MSKAQPSAPVSTEHIPPVAEKGADRFVEHQVQLHKWQEHLQMVLFNFCRVLQPSIIQEHHWSCYSAAELTYIAVAVSGFCKSNADAIESRGMTIEEFKGFIKDLRVCRLIRNAVAHCQDVTPTKMEKFAGCVCRMVAVVKQLLGPQYEKEMTAVLEWMESQGWSTDDMSTFAAHGFEERPQESTQALKEHEGESSRVGSMRGESSKAKGKQMATNPPEEAPQEGESSKEAQLTPPCHCNIRQDNGFRFAPKSKKQRKLEKQQARRELNHKESCRKESPPKKKSKKSRRKQRRKEAQKNLQREAQRRDSPPRGTPPNDPSLREVHLVNIPREELINALRASGQRMHIEQTATAEANKKRKEEHRQIARQQLGVAARDRSWVWELIVVMSACLGLLEAVGGVLLLRHFVQPCSCHL